MRNGLRIAIGFLCLFCRLGLAQGGEPLVMDINGDGVVNRADLPLLIQNRGKFSLQAKSLFKLSAEWMRHSQQRIDPQTGFLEVEVPLPNLPPGATALKMVRIPAGRFQMGSPRDERNRFPIEWLPHQVTISQSFFIGKFEVTQAQWQAVMGTNPAEFQGEPNRPVESISWNEAQQFLAALNQLNLGDFRLPAEAEWEYACRAGTTTAYSHGDAAICVNFGPAGRCPAHEPFMWYVGTTSGTFPRAVGTKLPNSWGLHDMHGNVFEWGSDFWQAPFNRGPVVDPQGPAQGEGHVIRSGSWRSGDFNCRSANRNYQLPDVSDSTIGLRLVADRLN